MPSDAKMIMESSSAIQIETLNKVQAEEPRLKYVTNPDTVRVSEGDCIEVKEAVRTRFDNLCKEAGWTPTDAIRGELKLLTKVDAEWRDRRCEAALFAFVQHLDFVWDDGYVLLGRKMFEEGVFAVGYRPLYEDKVRKIAFCYGPKHITFRPVGTVDRVDEDKTWPPFTKLFDFARLIREDQNIYLIGVYEILHKFKSMRRTLNPDHHGVALPSSDPPELPFLPGSKWLFMQRFHSSPRHDPRSETELRDLLLAQSQYSANGRLSMPNDARQQGLRTTHSACTRDSNVQFTVLQEALKRKRSATTDGDASKRKEWVCGPSIDSQVVSKSMSRSQLSSVDPLNITQNWPNAASSNAPAREALRHLMAHLMQHIEVSCSVTKTDDAPQVRITATLPNSLFEPAILMRSAMVSISTVPLIPGREHIIQALEDIAMSSLGKRYTCGPIFESNHRVSQVVPVASMKRVAQKAPEKCSMDQARQLLRGARIKLVSSGNEDERGLQMFEFDVSYPEARLESTLEPGFLEFSRIVSIETLPVVITKTQALKSLLKYAQEDEQARQ